MKTILSILTLLSMGMVVHASAPNKQSITNNNYGDNNKNDNHGGSQTGPKIGVHAHVHGHVGRSLKSLFVRDPDFDFAMGILARNAETAERTVDQIVANIRKGTVHPLIEQAALARGLVVKTTSPKMKRFLELEAREADTSLLKSRSPLIKGPQGKSHPVDEIAQHIVSGGRIPQRIIDELIASPYYDAPGQKPKAKVVGKGKPGQPGQPGQPGPGGTPSKKAAGVGRRPRDLDSLYACDVPEDVYVRDLEAFQPRDIHKFYARAAEAGVSLGELTSLIKATQDNPKAEKAVYDALTSDANVQKVIENLVRDWAHAEELGKA